MRTRLNRIRRNRRSKRRNLLPVLVIGCVVVTFLAGALVVFMGGGGQLEDSDEPAKEEVSVSSASNDSQSSGPFGTPTAPEGTDVAVRLERGFPFIWPANGPVLTTIGAFHPAGIEIGLGIGEGSEIRAAARGTVDSVGAQPGLGLQVEIDHGGNLRTAYGRLDSVLVSRGQVVAQGEVIGTRGDSRLYFEVNHRGLQIDPLDLLPSPGDMLPAPTVINCKSDLITAEAGAPLVLDFSGAFESNAVVARVDVIRLNGSANTDTSAVRASSLGGLSVSFETAPSVADSDYAAYELTVGIREGDQNKSVHCSVLVRSETVATSRFEVATQSLPPTPIAPESALPATPSALLTVQPTPTKTATPIPPPTVAPTPTKTPFPISN